LLSAEVQVPVGRLGVRSNLVLGGRFGVVSQFVVGRRADGRGDVEEGGQGRVLACGDGRRGEGLGHVEFLRGSGATGLSGPPHRPGQRLAAGRDRTGIRQNGAASVSGRATSGGVYQVPEVLRSSEESSSSRRAPSSLPPQAARLSPTSARRLVSLLVRVPGRLTGQGAVSPQASATALPIDRGSETQAPCTAAGDAGGAGLRCVRRCRVSLDMASVRPAWRARCELSGDLATARLRVVLRPNSPRFAEGLRRGARSRARGMWRIAGQWAGHSPARTRTDRRGAPRRRCPGPSS
jgi:hypothetical protein